MRGHLHTDNMKSQQEYCQKNQVPYLPWNIEEISSMYPPYPFPVFDAMFDPKGWELFDTLRLEIFVVPEIIEILRAYTLSDEIVYGFTLTNDDSPKIRVYKQL